jgi:sRNA-binding regulator protein Hfq
MTGHTQNYFKIRCSKFVVELKYLNRFNGLKFDSLYLEGLETTALINKFDNYFVLLKRKTHI